MAQTYRYPSSASASVNIGAQGSNGAPAPSFTLQVGGKDPSGNLQPLSVTTGGVLNVSIGNFPATQAINLTQVGGASVALGQAVMASSIPVVISSNQSAIPSSQSGTWNINNISGTISLPTGASTSALQTTGNTSLSSIDTKTPALGQTTMTASVPVTIASNQSALAISAASLPLPTGAATESTLSALSAKVPSLGQAVMASSQPVVIASNQSAIPVSTSALNITGSAAALNADAIASTDISAYSSLVVQVTGTFTGTITFQGSNDNTNFVSVFGQSVSSVTTAAVSTTTTTGMWYIPTGFRYFRARMTAYTSGTATGNAEAITNPPAALGQVSSNIANATLAVTQSGTWTVQPGNTANTTAWLMSEEKAATGTITSVSGAVTSTTVLASNAGRKQATFFNDSTATLYLAFASTASTTAYTVQILPGGYYELPGVRVFTGLVTGIWSAAAGAVRVTELT